jgi:DNA-binding LacI/PurR family transcriptional regulator
MVAVNEILAEFGHAGRGGIVRHVTTPDRFLAEMEATRDLIVSMADDPLMRAVVVFEGVPGTAEAFREIRARRPDILLFAAENHEDAELISRSADLVASQDFISRGYLVPWTARKLGADTLLHLSFPRHMTDESLYRRRVIMEKAAKDLGLRFVYEEAPDPQGEGGIEAARAYIASKFPEWLRRHGPNTAFFATNNSHTLPLIRGVIEQGGYFPEADEPSPLLGYPEALGLDPAELGQDPGRAVAMVEEALAAAGAGGRLGTWTASLAASHVKALTRFAIGIVQGKADPRDTRALLACYDASSPGVKWNGGALRDPAGREYPNVLLVYQDNYIFGSGYSGTASVKVPSKYGEMAVPTAGSGPQWDFHIAIVTGTREQGSDDHLGALEMIRRYGSSEDGGLVTHLIYPISFLNDPELTAELIASAASDPLLKAVVVNQAISGTAEGFRRIKARRPDVFCLSGEPHEDPGIITETADMVVAADYVARGYLIPYSARELGAKTLVHVTLPRHMTYFSMRQRAAVMERASAELGLGFHIEMAPDPTAPGGVEAARTFIAETLPEWLEKYGTATAFFATNDSHAEPLIAGITDLGGIFVEADIPSTLLGFPVALGVDPEPLVGDWPGLLKAVEDAAAARGAAGRLGTWAWPLGFTQTAGLTEFGRMLAEGRSDVYDVPAIIECLGLFSPGAHWAGSFLNDPATGRLVRNYLLVYQDTYILGRGYIATTKVDVPAEYFSIVPPDPPRTGAALRLPPPGSRPGPP